MQFDHPTPFNRKIEKCYHRKVHALCKTSDFRLIKSNQSKNPNQAFLESIIN